MIIILSGEDGSLVLTDLKYFHSIVNDIKDAYKVTNPLIDYSILNLKEGS